MQSWCTCRSSGGTGSFGGCISRAYSLDRQTNMLCGSRNVRRNRSSLDKGRSLCLSSQVEDWSFAATLRDLQNDSPTSTCEICAPSFVYIVVASICQYIYIYNIESRSCSHILQPTCISVHVFLVQHLFMFASFKMKPEHGALAECGASTH